MDFYTEIYVRFKNVSKLQSYSDEYKEKMEKIMIILKSYIQKDLKKDQMKLNYINKRQSIISSKEVIILDIQIISVL